MTTKCILFDADGVIIHSKMFSVQYQKKYDVPYEEILPFFTEVFPDCLVGKADLVKIVTPWLPKWKWEGSVDEFLQFWFEAENNVDERMVSVIQELRGKGIKCFLATNQEKYRTQFMRNDMGFGKLFDHVFSSGEIGYKKPSKGFYEFILNKIKSEQDIQPDEIMFFDDKEGHVEGAKELGIDAHLFEGFGGFKLLVDPLLEGGN